MIPRAYIVAWGADHAPWPDQNQVEQDLVISRLLVEIASHPLLSEQLAFRGGTCLHKLHLPGALRYSEDLDFVRTNQQPLLGGIYDAIRDIAAEVGVTEHRRTFPSINSAMGTIWFDAEPESQVGRIRIKIETNVVESIPVDQHIFLPYSVRNRWWSGSAKIRTFPVEEILGTKVRALCQRRKGRDLFDLWVGLGLPDIDDDAIVAALKHYMGAKVYSYPQLVQHLATKRGDPEFEADLGTLVGAIPPGYDQDEALEVVRRRIGLKLRNVPSDVVEAERQA
jgi:predicted nucleotidyltransferase component of viral defense system